MTSGDHIRSQMTKAAMAESQTARCPRQFGLISSSDCPPRLTGSGDDGK
jgi:hypothetical protein